MSREEKAERNRKKIDIKKRREHAIHGIVNEIDDTVNNLDKAMQVTLQTIDIDVLEGFVTLIKKARSAGWNDGCKDTERQYDEFGD